MAETLIWDGLEFRNVAESEAKSLVKKNQAQIMDGIVDGLSLKYRHEFDYDGKDAQLHEDSTMAKNMNVGKAVDMSQAKGLDEQPEQPEQLKRPDPVVAAPIEDEEPKAPTKKTYQTIRKEASEHFGIPYTKVTKDDVEKYKAEVGE